MSLIWPDPTHVRVNPFIFHAAVQHTSPGGVHQEVYTGRCKMKYRVHRFELKMTRDQHRLQEFLNQLEGELVSIIPNVTPVPATYVDFVLIVERIYSEKQPK